MDAGPRLAVAMPDDLKRSTPTSAHARLGRCASSSSTSPRVLSFVFASADGEVLESVASVLANRNIVSPVRLRDLELRGLLTDLERMHTLNMRGVVLLDADHDRAVDLRYQALAIGLEPPVVALLGAHSSDFLPTLATPFKWDEFVAFVQRVGGGWTLQGLLRT